MSIDREEFLTRLAEALDEDPERLEEGTSLESLASWDSIGQISTIALFDEMFQVVMDVGRLQACERVGDLLELAAADVGS